MSDSDKKKSSGKVDEDLVRNLANLLTETDISEIEIEQNGLRLRVARQMNTVTVAAAPVAAVAAPTAAPAAAAPAAPATTEGADLAKHPGAVTSPMVGTVYTSPDPETGPFVNVGDQVSEGQTILIVEAMKTMNNIPATKAGRIAQILVTNEQPIEFGEVLVIIE